MFIGHYGPSFTAKGFRCGCSSWRCRCSMCFGHSFVLLGIEKVRIVPGITAASPSALEVVVFFGGMYLYWRATRPVSRGGRYGMPIFGFIMLAVQGSAFVGPPPPSDQAVAITAFFSYLVFASVAYWLEKKRV